MYMRDRQIKVRYQGSLPKDRKTHWGMPQGAVSSPPLWNFFTADFDGEEFDVPAEQQTLQPAPLPAPQPAQQPAPQPAP